jgi:tetratricopeptide (TPR) repeat protein
MMTDKMSAAMQIGERVYSLAWGQNDAALMIGAYNALSCVLHFMGDFESARQYAMRGVQLWRSGGVPFHAEEFQTPVVACLCYGAMSEWHLGEIDSCQADMDEAISIAKELKDMHALALALNWAAMLAYSERNPAEGIRWIEHGIRECRATGPVLGLPRAFARKAEALHLAGRTSEALEAINEAEALAERFEQRYWGAELYRLRGVFLAAIGADEAQTEASFSEAIRTAREQKSISLAKRVEATDTEYRRQKASTSTAPGFRLPLC